MKKSPTDILREGHTQVLGILDSLEQGLEAKDARGCRENITILEREFDRHSLNREEKALFPELEKYIPRDGGPTGMMVAEHRDLTQTIARFKEALEKDDTAGCTEAGNHILSVLRQHIAKENQVLFNMADMHLDESQKELILKKFEEM